NAAELGLRVTACGFVGRDAEGERLCSILEESGVRTRGVIHAGSRTITKTRIIGGHQQMLRLDEEDPGGADLEASESLLKAIREELADGVSGVILSDYAKGALSEEVCRTVISLCRERGVPVFADPKAGNYAKYSGATAITPSRMELAELGRVGSSDLEALAEVGERTRHELGLDFMVVTLGEDGLALIRSGVAEHIPAVARDVFDVTGAGDTVIATLAAGVVAGLELGDAVRLANLAAGVVVGKSGTATVKRTELLDAISLGQARLLSDKICTLDALLERVSKWRLQGEVIGFTNGCFDVLHAGHVTYLQRARAEADRLIVGLNSDRSVRRLKGEGRPIIPQDQRALVLAALTSVDAVVLFDEDTPIELIKKIRPQVLIKGSDYTEDQVVGAPEVKSWGGRVFLVPLVDGQSTTGIVSRIMERAREG
ncbi:MAG: D-glycero-beta-D-manno-heptose 1-phosphate adenylyltransferase, partial [Armatimonadetes bacterium]|nr:D-glycero-beta-D-manno-heptose 1-phosphate adenylyltransferase [Armatimonadota bacterium]